VNVYEELSEASRRTILKELLKGPRNVSELVEKTGLKQPNVSNHLARMRAKGIVRATKDGRQVFYSIASADIEDAVRTFLREGEDEVLEINVGEAAKEYAKAAIRGDESTCADILDRCLRARLTILEVFQDFLGGAMATVGTWYKVEAIDEAQEHMASAITERMLTRTAQFFGPRARSERSAILGCAPHSWHVIGLRMINDYLRFCGWKTQYLGANVPVDSFVASVRENKPDLVLISCSAADSIESTLELLRSLTELRSMKQDFLVGVGGGAVQSYPHAFRDAGADFSSRDLKTFALEALPEIERVGRANGDWNDAQLNGLKQKQGQEVQAVEQSAE